MAVRLSQRHTQDHGQILDDGTSQSFQMHLACRCLNWTHLNENAAVSVVHIRAATLPMAQQAGGLLERLFGRAQDQGGNRADAVLRLALW